MYIHILEYRSLRSRILALRLCCGVDRRTAHMSDAAVLLTKKNQNGLIRFKISKCVKLTFNLLFCKFYDTGAFTLAMIVETPMGTLCNVANQHLV